MDSLKNEGFMVLDGVPEQMLSEVKEKFDFFMTDTFRKYHWKDKKESDTRFYDINQMDNIFLDAFLSNVVLLQHVQNYLKSEEVYMFVLANEVSYKKDNLGSGGGWHRDTFWQRQLKAFIYLTDVDTKSGPFEYQQYSQRPMNKLSQIAGFLRTRRNIRRSPILMEANNRDFCLRSGSIFLADTSGIHRGRPICKGKVRKALTLYISTKQFSDSVLKELPDTPIKLNLASYS